MSYIGNQPPDIGAYGVQSFDGGGTSFTLSKTSTTATVLLFIDGVRQTPVDAYSVSGTTLTTTGTTPSGTDNVTVQYLGNVVDFGEPSDDSVSTVKIQDDAVTAAKIDANAVGNSEMADDAVGIAELSATGTASATTFLRGDNSWTAISEYDDAGLQDDIALIGFKVAANGSLAKYNLVDQTVDSFEDASGVDTGSSTAGFRITTGNKYYVGATNSGVATQVDYMASSTFNAPAGGVLDGTAQVLAVAGGGGGGLQGGGGGGAGGVVYHATFPVTASQAYTVTIGAGGQGHGTGGVYGEDGEDTKFGGVTAQGGGRGGDGTANLANDGGSGGAPGYDAQVTTVGVGTQPAFTASQAIGGVGYGNNSGQARSDSGSSQYYGGGGGGGSAVGGDADSGGNAGDGGNGYDATTVFGTVGGASGIFAGGGGGGCHQSFAGTVGSGGTGGGAAGTRTGSGLSHGTANTGGGGGGCGAGDAGSGGSGFAAIKYTPLTLTYVDMTLISASTTAVDGAPTKGDLVVAWTDGVGTATLNTDIKFYISRDGTNYSSALTLVNQGTSGGQNIASIHDVDLSGIGSGTAMRYKITTHNQSVSKSTRVNAVSLGWS